MPTMQQQAIAKAQELGIAVEYEPHDDMIEVWSYDGHLTENPVDQVHTYFVHREAWNGKKLTDAGMWREALRYMEEDLVPCADDCECRATDETPAEQPEAPVSSTFGVIWPKAVGRIFWRALAKDSTEILATARGLSRHSNEAKGELTITGPHDEALALAAALPHLFTDANNFLKEWRKTSPNYKCHDLKTTEGRRDAWVVEQQFLRDFFRAVAGVAPKKEKSDGVRAGLAYAAGKAEDQ